MAITPLEDLEIFPLEDSEEDEIMPPDEDFPIAPETFSDEEEEYGEFASDIAEPEPVTAIPDNVTFERFKIKNEITRLGFEREKLKRKLIELIAKPEKAEAMDDDTNDEDWTDSDFTDENIDRSSLPIEYLQEEYHTKLEKAFRKDKTGQRIPWIDTVPSLKRLNERLAEYRMSMSAGDLLDVRRWIDRVFDQGMKNCLPYGTISASRFPWKKKYNENGLNDVLRLILREHNSFQDLEKLRRHYDRIIGKEMLVLYLKRRISVDSKRRESLDSETDDSDAAEEMK
ncbi:hypothetical protein OCU04_004555 [Sclerotinia nivalis]|uniref:Uncharacterized protein n=1 Tax=Sclerotinia nivalis TaxID=352851 RepID=A0A9X0AQN7_9HELO|nr:hypothetical protein OCU04_004555 [Sclerotinia nivalis]